MKKHVLRVLANIQIGLLLRTFKKIAMYMCKTFSCEDCTYDSLSQGCKIQNIINELEMMYKEGREFETLENLLKKAHKRINQCASEGKYKIIKEDVSGEKITYTIEVKNERMRQ